MKLAAITLFAHPDEKAYALVEVPLAPYLLWRQGYQPESWSGTRRYQIVIVNRDDRPAMHLTDMGLSQEFATGPFRIPAYWEHSVAELRGMAEQQHGRGDSWQREILVNAQGESTMRRDLERQFEQAQKNLACQSVFGPGITVQRNNTFQKEKVTA